MDRQTEFCEDEQPPVRRRISRPIQRLAVHSEAAWILLPNDVGGPTAARDLSEGRPSLIGFPRNAVDFDEVTIAGDRLHGIGEPGVPVRIGHGVRNGLGVISVGRVGRFGQVLDGSRSRRKALKR